MLVAKPSFYSEKYKLEKNDVPDCIWPTNNDLGIPVLKLSHQADALDLPILQWGSKRRSSLMNGTWAFYVDDYRFSALWKSPYKVINSGCTNVVEPNFTLHEVMPRALVLYKIYQKRWLSRYWQEHGNIKVFVDLNVNEEHWDDNMLGVPDGWRAYCTRGYKGALDTYDKQFELASKKAGHSDLLFVVYGGNKDVKNLCYKRQWIWIPESMDIVHKQKILEDVSNEEAKKQIEIIQSTT